MSLLNQIESNIPVESIVSSELSRSEILEQTRKAKSRSVLPIDEIQAPEQQVKARLNLVKDYPKRTIVSDDKREWGLGWKLYNPTYFIHQHVLDNDSSIKTGGWAEPENVSSLDFEKRKLTDVVWKDRDDIKLDQDTKRPLNPYGRTGIAGRGLLGHWGPNFAVDSLVVYREPDAGTYNLLVIQRKDGTWAFPGGMVDAGETKAKALPRELAEEAGISLGQKKGKLVFKGFCDDPRNTDNAWMETAAYLYLLNAKEAKQLRPKAGSDAKNWKWLPMTMESISELFASHPWIAKKALEILKKS